MSLSQTIEVAIEDLHRATAIYTTDPVVDALLDAVEWPSANEEACLLDPSAGDGAFVRRALARLSPLPGDRACALRVRGYEIHAGAVAEARANLAGDLRAMGWHPEDAVATATAMIEQRDFLTDALDETFRPVALVGNPPYLAFAKLPAYFKALYGKRLNRYTLADLLLGFIDRVCRVLPDEGRIALVTADRWLFNETAATLREVIGGRVGLRHLERLDPTTSFYRPKNRVRGSLPRVHPVAVVMEPAARATRAITAAPISPDGPSAESGGLTLGDIADVRIAPWLGPEGIFVIDPAVAASLVDAECVPAIDTDDIDPKLDLVGRPRRVALVTRPGCEPQGALRDHLLATRVRMPPRGQRASWWLPPETIRLPPNQPYLLVPRIARRLRVVDVPAGVLAINHNLTVIHRGRVDLPALRAILTSPASQEWIVRNASRLESGFYSITTKLLRRLPVSEEVLR